MMKKLIYSIAIGFAFVLCTTAVFAGTTIRYPGVSTASEGNVLLGVKGTYENVSSDKALNRINQIRKEAYNEGLVDEYKPIKWSEHLEFIAQIRAAESSVLEDHARPKGGYVFNMRVNGVGSWAENLAWGGNALSAIEMWYSEKEDLVKNTGGETGHYTSIINPDHTHIALGSFRRNSSWNCVSAEFTTATDISEGRTNISGDCIQLIEIPKANVKFSVSGADAVVKGGTASYKFLVKYNGKEMYAPGTKWSVSNSNASLTGNKLKGVKPGSTKITAANSDFSASKIVKIIKVNPTKFVSVKAKKKAAILKWKKQAVTGYQIQYSLKKNFKNKKTVTLKAASKKVTKLKSKKKYFFRVRTYKTVNKKKYYSSWSKIKAVKIK